MRFLVQVVTEAAVTVFADEKASANSIKDTRSIGKGLMVLIGVGTEDTEQIADKMTDKLLGLRIFADENGKTNLSVSDVAGSLLLVSQFTLYADCRHGNRPGFTHAAPPDKATALYERIVARCKERVSDVKTGEFGAYMHVSLCNDGPFTVLLDSDEIVSARR